MTNYKKITQSPKFQTLLQKKRSFIVPLTVFFLVFYFALPILTSTTDVLNNKAFGDVTWAWVFAFSQFAMTWILCYVYYKKASTFDRLAQEVLQEVAEDEKRKAEAK